MRFLLVLLLLLVGHPAQSACRQALVLALDVSSSIDAAEYTVQMQGLARVLSDPEVQSLFLSNPDAPIDLAIFEWAGEVDQRLIADWTRIESSADLSRIAARLSSAAPPGGQKPTALGSALLFAARLLAERPECWQHVIDVSGDGKNNSGVDPAAAKQSPDFDGVTVNALVIGKAFETTDEIAGNRIAELTAYFHHDVIHGPDAFIETALGFEDFFRAMKKKLLRETAQAIAQRPSGFGVGKEQLLAIDTIGRNQALPMR